MHTAFKWSALVGCVGVAEVDLHGQSGPPRYRFATMLDSRRDGLFATRSAAINTIGAVAVTAQDTVLEGTRIVTSVNGAGRARRRAGGRADGTDAVTAAVPIS